MGFKDHTGRSTVDRQVFGKGQVLWINKSTFTNVKCFCFLLLFVIFLTRTISEGRMWSVLRVLHHSPSENTKLRDKSNLIDQDSSPSHKDIRASMGRGSTLCLF